MTDRYSGDGAGHTVSFTVVSSTATNRPVRRCSTKKSTINWLLGVSATPSIAPNRLYSPVSGKVIGANPSSQGDYAHDGEIWQFPTSTSVPKPIQHPTPPMWIAARDPDSHDFAVRSGCNVMVTPLMKGDEEVVDLKRKFDTAVANHPEVPRPEIMVLRHTHVHSPEDPDGWRPAAEAISRFYRTFDAWFGNKTTPVDGFLEWCHSNWRRRVNG